MNGKGDRLIRSSVSSKIATAKRFRCKVGGEWREIEGFSNSQQKLVERQIYLGRPVDPAHCGMTCKEHSAGNRTHLTCGLCCLRKPVDEFSKNSRKNGEFNCKRCAAWTETQEPDVTPAPLETGHVSAEEREGQVWTKEFLHDTNFFGDSSPSKAFGLGSQIESTSSNASTIESSGSTTASDIPPHLRKKLIKAPPSDSVSTTSKTSASETVSSSSKQLPPHLKAKFASLPGLGSTARFSGDSASMSTSTTMRKENENPKHHRLAFNAWDSWGNQHLAVKSVTSASETTDASSASGCESGWETARVKSKVVRAFDSDRGQEKGKTRGKWHKGSECRIPQAELRRQERGNSTLAPGRPANTKEKIVFCEPDDDEDSWDA